MPEALTPNILHRKSAPFIQPKKKAKSAEVLSFGSSPILGLIRLAAFRPLLTEGLVLSGLAYLVKNTV